MAYRASFNFKLVQANIFDFISALLNIGWNYYNEKGENEYLPIGDKDAFNWQCKSLPAKELYEIIKVKRELNETIGLNFYYAHEKCGFSLLSNSDTEYNFDLCIYRKALTDSSTDIGWYHKKIVIQLRNEGIVFEKFCIDELIC